MEVSLKFFTFLVVALMPIHATALCLEPYNYKPTVTDWINYSICLSEENAALIATLSRTVMTTEGNSIGNMQKDEMLDRMSDRLLELDSNFKSLKDSYEILLLELDDQSNRIYYLEEKQSE